MKTVTDADIAKGIRDGEFILYYQPKVSLISNRIVGAEALARWRRADGSLMPPAAFIPVAERSALIGQLTLALLPKLIQSLAANKPQEELCVSFNVTARDFEDDTLTETLLEAVAQGRLRPSALELEITETQALQCGAHVLSRLAALTKAGIGLAMDDYGVGYSSIDTLSQWPFTTIKLDQGIVGRMLSSDKTATIVRSSIRLGHELGMGVVAEGVEEAAQHDFLVEAGCRLAQGYLVSRPLPLNEFNHFRRRAGSGKRAPIGLVHMAIIDHVQWRRQMVSYAVQRCALPHGSALRNMPGHPQLCLTECSLGKWYQGEGRFFMSLPLYRAIDRPHRTLHALGHDIVEHVRCGATIQDIVPLLKKLKQVSGTLIGLLEDIEDAGLQALYERPRVGGREDHLSCIEV